MVLSATEIDKDLSNVMALGHLVLAFEALSLEVAQGLDNQDLFEALKYGAGSSVMFRVAVPSALNGTSRRTFQSNRLRRTSDSSGE